MLRERLQAAFKDASASGDEPSAAILRLVQTALNERDQNAREHGHEPVDDEEILVMLRNMVEQRRQEIDRCETCAQLDLAEKEALEICILERFLPSRMSEAEIGAAVDAAIDEIHAARLKDAGKVIATLKQRYDGQMDFGCAKRLLCARLG